MAARPPHRRARPREACLAVDLELVLEMDVGGRDEDVDPFALRGLQRLSGEIDIAVVAARERRDDGTSDRFGDVPNTAKVALRGRGEAGFDHVHTQRVELLARRSLLS